MNGKTRVAGAPVEVQMEINYTYRKWINHLLPDLSDEGDVINMFVYHAKQVGQAWWLV